MGPIQVVVQDGNNLVLEVTPTPNTTVIIDRGIPGPVGPMGDGDVDGPASSTDNAVARFDGTTGKLIQNSNVTIDDSGNLTYPVGTANGVLFLNASKVLTTGSALTFDGTNLGVGGGGDPFGRFYGRSVGLSSASSAFLELNAATGSTSGIDFGANATRTAGITSNATETNFTTLGATPLLFGINASEQMRLTSTGLGIGTSSPQWKLDVQTTQSRFQVRDGANTGGTSAGTGLVSINAAATALDSFNYRATVHAFIVDSTEAMRLTSTGLGIGTSSPFLTAAGRGNVTINGSTDAVLVLGNAAATAGYLYAASTKLELDAGGSRWMQFNTGGNERMRLDSSGNLGLGVTPSAWGTLKAIDVDTWASFAGFTNQTGVLGNAYFDGSNYRYKQTAVATRYEQNNSGVHAWLTAPSGTAGDAISFTQAMTLDASGNLGVGTTSPLVKLHTSGSGTVSNYITTSDSGGVNLYLQVSGSAANIGSPNGVPLTFTTANVERARITSGGAFIVGDTSVVASGFAGVKFDGASFNGFGLNDSAAANTAGYIYFQSAGTTIGSITRVGATSAVAYNSTSDQRLKENIQDAESASALIDAIKVRQYDWKSDGSHQRYGFVAQELVTVAPEAVHQPEDPEAMMAVDYSKLVPMLVKEIQALRARVAALESI